MDMLLTEYKPKEDACSFLRAAETAQCLLIFFAKSGMRILGGVLASGLGPRRYRDDETDRLFNITHSVVTEEELTR